MIKKSSQKVLSKIATKKVIKHNAEAIKSYEKYKKTADLIERANYAV